MKIRNNTNLSDDFIREMVRAVKPAKVSNFTLRITNTPSKYARGRAYSGSGRVLVRLPKADTRYITTEREGKGYLGGILIGSRTEAFVYVLSHELRHLWQREVPRGWRVWGARGRYSERDADAYALQCLRKYRRGELLDQTMNT